MQSYDVEEGENFQKDTTLCQFPLNTGYCVFVYNYYICLGKINAKEIVPLSHVSYPSLITFFETYCKQVALNVTKPISVQLDQSKIEAVWNNDIITVTVSDEDSSFSWTDALLTQSFFKSCVNGIIASLCYLNEQVDIFIKQRLKKSSREERIKLSYMFSEWAREINLGELQTYLNNNYKFESKQGECLKFIIEHGGILSTIFFIYSDLVEE